MSDTATGKHLDRRPEDDDPEATQVLSGRVVDDEPADEPDGGPGFAAEDASAFGNDFVQGEGGARRSVVCPECGVTGQVTVNRRESEDFCTSCDFPLFWTPSQVLRDQDGPGADALRRLPGVGGRARVGSMNCPHCAESNPHDGVRCLRCDGLLRPPAPAPAPAVAPRVVVPEPEPEPEPRPWWPWALGGVTLLLFLALVLYLTLRG